MKRRDRKQIAAASRRIEEALGMGVAGDVPGGCMHLVPLIEAGHRTCYSLACGLAHTAAFIAMRDQKPGAEFGFLVDNLATGEECSSDDLPSDLAFAGRFITAWGNQDRSTCHALYADLVKRAEESEGAALVDGLLRLYTFAVVTATEIVAEVRRARGTG